MSQSLIQQARDIAADQCIRLAMKNPNGDQTLFVWARHIQRYTAFMREGAYDDDISVQATLVALRSTQA